VVQVFAGTGFGFAPNDPAAARAMLAPVFDAARQDSQLGDPARAFWADELDDGVSEDERATIYDQIRAMSVRERMRLARSGGRAERAILMKDTNKTVHTFLVQNPRIQLDEVRYMAGFRQCGPDALKLISENRLWMQSLGVVQALVRNPKTPSAIAVRLLDRLPKAEVARIARTGAGPKAVVEAAKRRVIGGG
jgi:hypothetical protein